MGVPDTVCTRLTIRLSPHQHEWKFSISPNPSEVIPEFWNPRTTFENTPLCAHKYSIVQWVGGSLNTFLIGILIFL